MSLIVTGSIGIDTIETPSAAVEEVIGGSIVYFAAGARFFCPVRLVGAVGDDFPDHFLDVFKSLEADLTGLERRAGSKTFRWHGRYHENLNHRDTVGVELNVLGEAPPPVPDAFRDSEFIFLATTAPANQLALLDAFPHRKIVVADTIDLYIKTERDALLEVIKRIDGVVINDEEAMLLTGESNTIVAADKIVDMGPEFAIIKKGEHGAVLRHNDGFAALPGFPSNRVVDPTGAGDSFAAGIMGYLAATGDTSLDNLRRALAYGTVVASFTIEAFSVNRLLEVTREDIDQRLKAFAHMLKVD